MQEQEELLNQLCAKIDNGEVLNEYETGVKDVLSWMIDGADKPIID